VEALRRHPEAVDRYVKRGNPWRPREPGRERVEGRVRAHASHKALAEWNKVSVVCGKCGALRDWKAMARAANKKRGRVRDDAGCVCCSVHYRVGKDGGKQRTRAREILQGERIVVRQPARVNESSVWVRGDAAECALQVLLRFGDE